MNSLALPEAASRYAGLVMTQAASIASVLEPGELICPFIVIAKGEDRQSIEFEADSQDEAVSKAWDSLEHYKDQVDLWALAREGLRSTQAEKKDVLVVAVWASGMLEPAIFVQGFRPQCKGGFSLVGPVEVQDLPEESLAGVGRSFMAGVEAHPKGRLWKEWRADDAQQSHAAIGSR
jgi:hypothetical protein